MSSSDFTFITLRNITAYQPTGSWVPQNYVLNMSTNGAAAWTNSITLETIRGSSIIGNAIIGTNIVGNEILGTTITGSTIYGDTIIAAHITGDNIIGRSTIIGSTIYGTNIGGSNVVGSTIVGSTIIGSNIAAISSIVVAPSFFSTISNYNYTGVSTISSILIGIGDNIWKIPVEFVQENLS